MRYKWTTKAQFDSKLDANVKAKEPLFFTILNTKGTSIWPYLCKDGHFTNICGRDPNENAYFFADPFYYASWLPKYPHANGRLTTAYEMLLDVNTQRFSVGNNTMAY